MATRYRIDGTGRLYRYVGAIEIPARCPFSSSAECAAGCPHFRFPVPGYDLPVDDPAFEVEIKLCHGTVLRCSANEYVCELGGDG